MPIITTFAISEFLTACLWKAGEKFSEKTIGKHIKNVFTEGELIENSTVANFAIVQNEGGRS